MKSKQTGIKFFSLFCLVLVTACGVSKEQAAATMAVQTIEARVADIAAPPTNTPPSTNTPESTGTPTSILTPTPLPEPDAKAMIAWRELGFPEEYMAFSPSVLGLEEGADAFSLPASNGSTLDYTIEGSFVFVDGEEPTQLIYGYTVLLPSSADTDAFDEYSLNGLSDLIGEAFGVPVNLISSIANANDIGNLSAGVIAPYSRQGIAWQISMISFRIENIGAWVFVRNKADIQLPSSVENVARVYASSIQQPEINCKLVSVEPDIYIDTPAFNFEAEGFYPHERRYISLKGGFLVENETKTATNAKMGLTGEKYDKNGYLADTISFLTVEQLADQGFESAELSTGPTDFTLTVGGYASGCEVEQIVTWPGLPTTTPSTVIAIIPETVTQTSTSGETVASTSTTESQQFLTEEFDEDLDYWSTFSVDITSLTGGIGHPYQMMDVWITGQKPRDSGQSVMGEDGFLKFNNNRAEATYAIYDPVEYEEVRIDAQFENKGSNTNFTGLVCQYSENVGWYEIVITPGSGMVNFAKIKENGAINYYGVEDGSTYDKVKSGVNDISIICEGNRIAFYLNDALVLETSITNANFSLESGKVGVVVASHNQLPVTVNFSKSQIGVIYG